MLLLKNAKHDETTLHKTQVGSGFLVAPQDPFISLILKGTLGGATVDVYLAQTKFPDAASSHKLGTINALSAAGGATTFSNLTRGYLWAAVVGGDGTTDLTLTASLLEN